MKLMYRIVKNFSYIIIYPFLSIIIHESFHILFALFTGSTFNVLNFGFMDNSILSGYFYVDITFVNMFSVILVLIGGGLGNGLLNLFLYIFAYKKEKYVLSLGFLIVLIIEVFYWSTALFGFNYGDCIYVFNLLLLDKTSVIVISMTFFIITILLMILLILQSDNRLAEWMEKRFMLKLENKMVVKEMKKGKKGI